MVAATFWTLALLVCCLSTGLVSGQPGVVYLDASVAVPWNGSCAAGACPQASPCGPPPTTDPFYVHSISSLEGCEIVLTGTTVFPVMSLAFDDVLVTPMFLRTVGHIDITAFAMNFEGVHLFVYDANITTGHVNISVEALTMSGVTMNIEQSMTLTLRPLLPHAQFLYLEYAHITSDSDDPDALIIVSTQSYYASGAFAALYSSIHAPNRPLFSYGGPIDYLVFDFQQSSFQATTLATAFVNGEVSIKQSSAVISDLVFTNAVALRLLVEDSSFSSATGTAIDFSTNMRRTDIRRSTFNNIVYHHVDAVRDCSITDSIFTWTTQPTTTILELNCMANLKNLTFNSNFADPTSPPIDLSTTVLKGLSGLVLNPPTKPILLIRNIINAPALGDLVLPSSAAGTDPETTITVSGSIEVPDNLGLDGSTTKAFSFSATELIFHSIDILGPTPINLDDPGQSFTYMITDITKGISNQPESRISIANPDIVLNFTSSGYGYSFDNPSNIVPTIGSSYPLFHLASARGIVEPSGEFNITMQWTSVDSVASFSFVEVDCPSSCPSNTTTGSCASRFRCTCIPGWAGHLCDTPVAIPPTDEPSSPTSSSDPTDPTSPTSSSSIMSLSSIAAFICLLGTLAML